MTTPITLEDLPAPIVVCCLADSPAEFSDDMFGACAICDAAVRFGPHWPARSSLVCLLCFLVQADPDTVVLDVTAESLEELAHRTPCRGRES